MARRRVLIKMRLRGRMRIRQRIEIDVLRGGLSSRGAYKGQEAMIGLFQKNLVRSGVKGHCERCSEVTIAVNRSDEKRCLDNQRRLRSMDSEGFR